MVNEVIDQQWIEVPCLVAKQPIGEMYTAIIDSQELVYLSFTDVRRLRDDSDNREIEDYIGIQRELSTSREKKIGQYVNLVDASFPNSIILSMSSEDAVYYDNKKVLKIKYSQDVAKVLDGQHRIAGLQHYEKSESFECIVTIYIDMALEDQAIIFSTINKEHKGVNPSLVADLYAFAESRSPMKTAHVIARALTSNPKSPFFKKISILGKANAESETITQATFSKYLINYISKNPQIDRNFFKEHTGKNDKLPEPDQTEAERYFFRRLFIHDDSDLQITQNLVNYFSSVSDRWPNAWNVNKRNMVLNRSTGFIALMRFLGIVYPKLRNGRDVVPKEEFSKVFKNIDISEDYFNRDNYKPGSSGQSDLYKDFVAKSEEYLKSI